ncbi:MAG: DUF6768 family protein [Phycisphaerales bacterium]
MNDTLDDKIRESLNPSDAELIGAPEEGLRIDQLVFSVFKTRNRNAILLTVFVSIIFLGIGIYLAIKFFQTDDTKLLLSYGFGFLCCMMVISMHKIWFWMEMQRIAVTREVKRVELLTARLLQELRNH